MFCSREATISLTATDTFIVNKGQKTLAVLLNVHSYAFLIFQEVTNLSSRRLSLYTLKNYIMLNTKIKEASGYSLGFVFFFFKSQTILYSSMKTYY